MNDTEMDRESRQNNSPGEEPHDAGGGVAEAGLRSILHELKEIRRENQQQFSEIKQHMKKTDDRMEMAEGRIEETETLLHASLKIIKQLTKRQTEMETAMVDQNARSRRENLRFYSIREDTEGTDMIAFLDKLLKTTLGLPEDTALDIQRAHRALGRKPTDVTRPRSIVAKFGSYRVKEDILQKAWQKKELWCDNVRFYVDHDYPPEVMKRRAEYTEARKVLKSKKIKFHTPYPFRMRVYYDEGVKVYQNATEATRDMARRGFQITVIKPPTEPLQEELQLLSTWETVGRRRDRGEDREPGVMDSQTRQGRTMEAHRGSQYKDRLRQYRRLPDADEEED